MPELKTYDLFLSHAWRYNDDYYRLENLLNQATNFKWRNYSVPTHDPLIDPKSQVGRARLLRMLNDQIRPVNCVLILAGLYVSHSDWIPDEIDIAAISYKKPIIGIIPQGNVNVPKKVQDVAKEIVGWSTNSIVAAIRKYSI
jgi:antiphage defense system Thoeris ThsB-like protein